MDIMTDILSIIHNEPKLYDAASVDMSAKYREDKTK